VADFEVEPFGLGFLLNGLEIRTFINADLAGNDGSHNPGL
jgi:hypothetical protein